MNPSPAARRILALLIDATLVLAASYLFTFKDVPALYDVLAILGPSVNPNAAAFVVQTGAIAIIYSAFFDGVLAATPAKWALGLKVTSSRYHRPLGWRRGLRRALFGILDWLLLTAFLLPLISAAGRTIGDRFSGALVVERRPATRRSQQPDPAASLRRRAVGREAEDRVAARLGLLQHHGYTIFTNIEHRAVGDIDAVAAGPGGVFCVEVKGHSGVVTQEPFSGTVLRDGQPLERDVRAQLGRQLEFLSGYLYMRNPKDPMHGLICFPRAHIVRDGRGIFPPGVLGVDDVISHILDQPSRLSQRQLRKVVSRLSKLSLADRSPVHPDSGPTPSGRQHRRHPTGAA